MRLSGRSRQPSSGTGTPQSRSLVIARGCRSSSRLRENLSTLGRHCPSWLGTWLQSKSGQWRPNVLKFSLNLLGDLQPRAITRDLDWGVPIPLDGWRDRRDKRIYVWFDAVIGYLSASIEWARRSRDADAWRAWWQEPDALGYYFMGKDNIVFHSEIWPAMLLGYAGNPADGPGSADHPVRAAGSLGALNLPSEVVSSEYLTMEGRKFSSS